MKHDREMELPVSALLVVNDNTSSFCFGGLITIRNNLKDTAVGIPIFISARCITTGAIEYQVLNRDR